MNKREAILEAAERRFYAAGFHATGIDRVVAEAGVTPRTLYRHFPSKEALVRAVLERREARYLALLDDALAVEAPGGADPWSRLFARLADWLEGHAANGCMFLHALAEYAERDEAIVQYVLGHKRRVRARLYERLEATGMSDADERADAVSLLIEGAVAMAPVAGADTVRRHAAAMATTLFATEDTAPDDEER